MEPGSSPSPELHACMEEIRAGLASSDELPVDQLSDEDREMLESLGYIEGDGGD